jgi:Uma2 family endonuclease
MSHATASPVVWTATVEDLSKVEGKAELVDGRLVRMSPASGIHGDLVREILLRLHAAVQREARGRAYGDNVGFAVDLPHRRSFAPDVAYYVGPPSDEGFLVGAPALAIEIRSPEDFGPRAEEALARKRADYFAAGTQVVWDVDPLRERVVRAYRAAAPDSPDIFREGDEADAEPAVPGWRVRVDELMPPGVSTTG